MARGFFVITELFPDGSEVRQFVWSADATPPTGAGGARACPVKPWEFAGKQRNSRTDYSGSRRPSVQVLGPSHEPFTLSGTWDSRYNFAGYSSRERARFEAMARRGNQCRFQYDDQVIVGLIATWKFPYENEYRIRYTFSVDAHYRPEDDADVTTPPPSPPITRSIDASEAYLVEMQEADKRRPHSIIGELGDTVTGLLTAVDDKLETLQATLDQRQIDVIVNATITPFKRLATQMRTLRGSTIQVVDDLADARQDVALATSDAIAALDFEVWTRLLRENARRISGANYQAAQEVEARDVLPAQTLYRPTKGESLYRIARQFYGTPEAWRLIADRNNLHVLTLTGEELLVIPERRQT